MPSSDTTATPVRLLEVFPEVTDAGLLVHRSHSTEVRQVTWHRHRQGELLWPATGALRVSTLQGTWVIPPSQAIWLPGNEPHEVNYLDNTELHAYFPDVKLRSQLPAGCCSVVVSSSLQNTLELATQRNRWLDKAPETQRLLACLGAAHKQPDHFDCYLRG